MVDNVIILYLIMELTLDDIVNNIDNKLNLAAKVGIQTYDNSITIDYILDIAKLYIPFQDHEYINALKDAEVRKVAELNRDKILKLLVDNGIDVSQLQKYNKTQLIKFYINNMYKKRSMVKIPRIRAVNKQNKKLEITTTLYDIKLVKFDEYTPSTFTSVIDIDKFEKLIDDNNFIDKYKNAVNNLVTEKLKFYTKRIDELDSEYESMVQRSNMMRTIQPNYDVHHAMDFTSVINERVIIQNIINKLKMLNIDIIQSNLKDILYDEEYGLRNMVGRDYIKNTLIQIIYSFANNPILFNKTFTNFAIYGPSGIGKTLLGKNIAYLLSKAMLLINSEFNIKSKSDLISQWLGGTSIKTKNVLLSSLEGVLFIDEAYQLVSKTAKDYGADSITEMLTFLDKYIGKISVIVAGYEDRMETFMKFNQGLPRRFPYTLRLQSYTSQQLLDLLIKFLYDNGINDNELSDNIYTYLSQLINTLNNHNLFPKQAGDIQNLSIYLTRRISSLYDIKWNPNDETIFIPVIKEAFNDYLEYSGYNERIE